MMCKPGHGQCEEKRFLYFKYSVVRMWQSIKPILLFFKLGRSLLLQSGRGELVLINLRARRVLLQLYQTHTLIMTNRLAIEKKSLLINNNR